MAAAVSNGGQNVPDEQEMGVRFPVAGVDASCEYTRQPADTTPIGANVRAYDQMMERERGGSRAGLSKFLNETVSGTALIQHLNVLVDPTVDALSASAFNDDPGAIEDPSGPAGGLDRNILQNPDGTPSGVVRKVRAGGSANRHRTDPGNRPVLTGFNLVKQTQATNDAFEDHDVAMPFAPALNNLVIVAVSSFGGSDTPGDCTVTVSGDTSGSFSQIGSYERVYDTEIPPDPEFPGSGQQSLSLWYKVTGVGETGISVSVNQDALIRTYAVEFSGNDTASPFDSSASVTPLGDSPLLVPNCTVSGLGEMVFGAFYSNNVFGFYPTGPNGDVTGGNGFSVAIADILMILVYKRAANGPGNESPAAVSPTGYGGPENYCGIAASFKKA